ncbi:cytochrome p450 [Fusarium beomiforme]|uniref:Cytochrome p450 n=1 Tax=Fusarium beomiforme TaxID=44412 RepID=A0A9P5A5W2_9HYPO|nr:cytochrome p450 [Fusarium beomiforme]
MAQLLRITEYSPLACLAAAVLAVTAFQVLRAVYRLYFHPLSKFPGPRSAAISRQWQAKIVRMGFPEKEYEKLHSEFGTKALRIGPNHLHISDPSVYKVIYSQVNPFPKEQAFYDSFESHHTVFSETNAQLHKERRKLLNPLFSKSGVNKLEPLLLEKVEETKSKIKRISHAGPINVWPAFRCMTVDIVSEFSFGTCINMINEYPNTFKAEYLDAMGFASQVPFLRYYSTTQRLVSKLVPLSVAANFSPILRQMERMITTIVDSYHKYNQRTTQSSLPVVFDYLQLLPADLQKAEAINTFIAGSDTTAFTLTTALYHILRLPEVEKTLIESLDEVFEKSQAIPSLVQLEQVKYLRACVNEALRVAMAVPGMLPRIVPRRAQPFVVDGKVVPPGTLVGMSAYTMNTNPQIWGQDAKSFNPGRWLGPNAKELETHMCTFSKGARQCIGINVAYAEITITLAHFFYHFKMELKTKEFHTEDRFTQEVIEPGLLVDFKLRQHS